MMSKKNYEEVAQSIRGHIEWQKGIEGNETGPMAIASLARELATAFKSDNPRFRYDTFYAACGLDEWGRC